MSKEGNRFGGTDTTDSSGKGARFDSEEKFQGLCFEIPENQLFWQTVEFSLFEKALKLAKDELIAPV